VSNLCSKRTPPGRGRKSRSGTRWGVALSLATLLWASRGRADDNPFEAWARMIAYQPAKYRGPTVAFPSPRSRPWLQGWVLRSERWPLAVHTAPALPRERAERALRALEAAYDWLHAQDWPLPYPDGGLGGSADFDLYLVPGLERSASAAVDAPIAWSTLDATTSYALLDSALPGSALERCAFSALTQAALLGQDPAEVDSVRQASAAFATWLAIGELGCDDMRVDAQRTPQLGPVGDQDEQTTTLALWLAMISQRHDGGDGRFIRELWQIARQHSEQADALHVWPSFWQALGAALDKAGESLDQAAEELAVARYFAASGAAQGTLPRVPLEAEVPVVVAPALASLPRHLPASEPPLGTYGSAYTRVPTRGARDGTRLEVWLRGEPVVRWSLVAVRLDAQGRELGRVRVPPRRVPESFLPVELTSDTAEVLLVVTELPWQRPDERAEGDDAHYFLLILNAARR
jgi:hypothetical protein